MLLSADGHGTVGVMRRTQKIEDLRLALMGPLRHRGGGRTSAQQEATLSGSADLRLGGGAGVYPHAHRFACRGHALDGDRRSRRWTGLSLHCAGSISIAAQISAAPSSRPPSPYFPSSNRWYNVFPSVTEWAIQSQKSSAKNPTNPRASAPSGAPRRRRHRRRSPWSPASRGRATFAEA